MKIPYKKVIVLLSLAASLFGTGILSAHAKDIRFIAFNGEQFSLTTSEDIMSLRTTLPSQTEVSLERKASDLVLTAGEYSLYTFQHSLENGYTIDNKSLQYLLQRAQQQEDHVTITIPYTTTPAHIFLEQGGKKEQLDLVSEGVSDFSGSSPSRIHNIETAVKKFNGLVIQPGEVFSFNEHLGEVEGYTGYKLELVIKGPRTIPEYGGGVCQVSSTVYRAALAAGMPIDERKGHSYAVSYYEPWGSDATIYPGVVDLKFTNDFDYPLIVHGYTEGEMLHFNLYGKRDAREVSLIGPKIFGHMGAPNPTVEQVTTLAPGQRVWKEYGHNGFHASWERVINKNGTTSSEQFTSIYEARGGYVLEGAAAPSQPETSTESQG